MSKRDVVVLGAARSAIGTFNGSLADIEPAELAGMVMKEAVKRSGVDPKAINYVTVGNTIPTEARFRLRGARGVDPGRPADGFGGHGRQPAVLVGPARHRHDGAEHPARRLRLRRRRRRRGHEPRRLPVHRHAQRRAHGRYQAHRHHGGHADRPLRRRPHGHHRREPGHQVGHHARGAGRAGGGIASPRRGGHCRRALQVADRAHRQADAQGRGRVRYRRTREGRAPRWNRWPS